MATVGSLALTYADWAKRLDPDGKTATVVELLSQTNEILEDAVFMEGNLPTGHRVSIRTGLPDVYWRSINQGVRSASRPLLRLMKPAVSWKHVRTSTWSWPSSTVILLPSACRKTRRLSKR